MPVTSQIRVRYVETDQMGVVYHANYLVWFEIGRVELLRALGFSYSLLEKEHGCILPVVEARCRYRSSARFDDEILIEARPLLLRGSILKFAYRIFLLLPQGMAGAKEQSGDERKLLAEGETTHVVCDAQMQRCALPPQYAEILRSAMATTS